MFTVIVFNSACSLSIDFDKLCKDFMHSVLASVPFLWVKVCLKSSCVNQYLVSSVWLLPVCTLYTACLSVCDYSIDCLCLLVSQESSGSGQPKTATGSRKKVKRRKNAQMQGGLSKPVPESPFASPFPSNPDMLEPFFLDCPPPPGFVPGQASPSVSILCYK